MRRFKRSYKKNIDLTGSLEILWTTDTHLWEKVDNKPNEKNAVISFFNYYDGSRRLRNFVETVNKEKPSAVIHTGDMIERDDDWEFFNSIWNNLDENIPQGLTIGNHDLVPTSYEEIIGYLGYQDKSKNGGSKLNQSFEVYNENVSVKIIMMDSNIDHEGNHIVTSMGFINQPALEWLDNELEISVSDVNLICTHHGFHGYTSGRFDKTDSFKVLDIVNKHKDKTIYNLFGHEHQNTQVKEFNSLGNFKGFLSPCMIDYDIGKYSKIYVLPNKKLFIEPISILN